MIQQTIEAPAAEAATVAFTIDRDELHEALALLCKVVERRNTIPILSHLLFEPTADASGVAITGADLDIQLTVEARCRWEGTGRFCLVATTVADIVKKAERGAHLEFRLSDGKAEMISGRTRGKLAYLPADDFPMMEARKEGEEATEFTLPAAQLVADLAHVAWAEGREETRYYLVGTALQVREDAFYMVALDGHNCAWVTRGIPEGAEALPDSILPRKAGDITRRMLKGGGGSVEIATTGRRMVIETPPLRLIAKLIDGTFPDWRSIIPADDAELQIVGLPEAEPRIPASSVEMVRKALGAVPVMEMTEDCVRFTVPDAPEFCALAMLLKADALPKGYAYETPGHERALEYLTGLAEAASLPQFSHVIEWTEYPDEERVYNSRQRRYVPAKKATGVVRNKTVIDHRLCISDGMVLGACFGKQTSHAGKDHEYVEEPDYETLTMRTVRREVIKEDAAWQEGAYCVAMPRERAGMAAAVTMGTPGVDERAVATKNGAIMLDAAAVARLCGDPADWERVEIKSLYFHHGRILPQGIRPRMTPRLTTVAPDARGRTKARSMSDREVMQTYTADPAGTIAQLQPFATVEAIDAVAAIVEFARMLSGEEAGTPAVETAEPPSAEIDAPAEPSEAPLEAREEETAVPQPAEPEIAPEAAQGPDTGGFAVAGEVIGALFAEMRARIEALEAAVNSSGTQPEAENGATPAAQLSDSNNFTRERRLRIVRAYLRLRRQRDGARHATELAHDMNRNNLLAGRAASDRADRERHKRRAAIRHALRLRTLSRENAKANARAVSEERRAEHAEFNAADLEKRLEEARAQLAAETARADSADARWNVVLDEKQARLVALQNEVIELRSGGRIKLTPPLRANAQPVWNAGRMQ
jgi:DNA polymerase-3 subunit beta